MTPCKVLHASLLYVCRVIYYIIIVTSLVINSCRVYDDEVSDDITQQQLLPDVKDPNMWTLKCRMGEEKATAMLLMRKFITSQQSNSPLQIKSVVVPEGLKGINCLIFLSFSMSNCLINEWTFLSFFFNHSFFVYV